MPQLDGIRAFAVLGVLPVHFVKEFTTRLHVDTGHLGVKLFFVLSGYLIAGILLAYRDKLDRGEATKGSLLQTFYIRRFLRLSPVYYLYLAFAALAIPGVLSNLGWFLTYTQNFLFAIHPETFSKYLAHFWTLAIEEQFYLVAPILLLSIPRSRIVAFCAVLVAAGVLFRVIGLALNVPSHSVRMMMPAQLDTLGIGALLASLRWQYGIAGPAARLAHWGLRCGAPTAAVCLVLVAVGILPGVTEVLLDLGLALVFVWLVARTSNGFDGRVGSFLQWAPLCFIGRISYGIYVYHFNVPGLVRGVARHAGLPLPTSEVTHFLLCAILSIAIASISYHTMERYVGRLKSRYHA